MGKKVIIKFRFKSFALLNQHGLGPTRHTVNSLVATLQLANFWVWLTTKQDHNNHVQKSDSPNTNSPQFPTRHSNSKLACWKSLPVRNSTWSTVSLLQLMFLYGNFEIKCLWMYLYLVCIFFMFVTCFLLIVLSLVLVFSVEEETEFMYGKYNHFLAFTYIGIGNYR